ncbi:DUF3052 family protein [Pedobacter sp. ASV28]|uniref:DUF3052 family protein n=1 Tax=Pedobacter sp. ASV28 TaxID=2795123 RepID=UPI0018EB77A8|nr:DUF3052 family protein [Pedobacter sp. ASV28]
MKTTGYSGTPLAKKLGIKEHFKLLLINTPAHYFDLLVDLPKILEINESSPQDLIHYFTKQLSELDRELPFLKSQIKDNGMIWISWPKKSAKVPTDLTEDLIREIAIKNGLIDVKVCAVDEIWSGLKLVIPVKNRRI